jgi:hypothetical protein
LKTSSNARTPSGTTSPQVIRPLFVALRGPTERVAQKLVWQFANFIGCACAGSNKPLVKKNVPHSLAVNGNESSVSSRKLRRKGGAGFQVRPLLAVARQALRRQPADESRTSVCYLTDGNKKDVAVAAATPKRAGLGNTAPAPIL